MDKNKKTLLILVVLLVVLVGAYVLYDKLVGDFDGGDLSNVKNVSQSKDRDKEKAVDFNVEDIEGNKVKLSEKKGKAVVVNFWASWCGPCKGEMPAFDKMFEKYGEDVEFMMVNMTDNDQETKKVASDFIKSQGYKFPVYYDVDVSAAQAYNVMSIPATYFIDKDGYVVANALGAIDEATLENGIKKIN